MGFKEDLKNKIPAKYQFTPEFNILLKIIKQKKIDTPDKLKKYINKQIKEDQAWINERKKYSVEGTMSRWMIGRTRRLDFCKVIKKKILGLI